MPIATFKEALNLINRSDSFSFSESFDLGSFCSRNLGNGAAIKARDLVIRLLEKKNLIHPSSLPMWNDIVEAAGLHPYINPEDLEGSSLVRCEYHRSTIIPEIVFHEEQLPVSIALLSGQSVVISAPTSFGKSLLIEELVASRRYKNLVIIQPTIALLDETRKRLMKYSHFYKIIMSTSQAAVESGNLFLFTAERVVEYKNFPKIEFFIIDEFYKLSLNRDDQRAIVLNHALHKLSKFTKRFYMLGPMIKSVPAEFHNQYEFKWIHTLFQTVSVDEEDVKLPAKANKGVYKEALFDILSKITDQTLVYCSSPNRATTLALEYAQWKKESGSLQKKLSPTVSDTIEWISANIHPMWGLVDCLLSRIAFHHGSVPRHLGSTLVDHFNSGEIDVLFCTSTLIEGVNTTARNVVLFDRKKGPKPIDYFDYRNIAGRSGRMKMYFVGRVIRFHPEPDQLELDVDIPAITQELAPIELLIQLDRESIIASRRSDLESFYKLDLKLQELIRENSGVPVEGQIGLLQELDREPGFHSPLLSWRRLPSYEQLKHTIDLMWHYLLSKKDNKAGVRSPAQLAVYTIQYQRTGSIQSIIRTQIESEYWKSTVPDESARVNQVTALILSIVRNWFDFRLPKLLSTLNKLQKFAFEKTEFPYGDYAYYASTIENSLLPAELAAVLEYDVPASALHKILSSLPTGANVDELVQRIRSLDLNKYNLNSYEIQKIRQM